METVAGAPPCPAPVLTHGLGRVDCTSPVTLPVTVSLAAHTVPPPGHVVATAAGCPGGRRHVRSPGVSTGTRTWAQCASIRGLDGCHPPPSLWAAREPCGLFFCFVLFF